MLRKAGVLERFSDVPSGIHYGFSLGVSSTITSIFSPPNHKSALDNKDFVTTQINKEVALGCYSEPLEPALFFAKYGPYRTSPLGVVSGSKLRLIQDHSFPCSGSTLNSINSEIDTSRFQCDWGSFLDCFSAVLDAHPGTQVAVFDVDSAHRRMPIRPRDRLHVCVAWQGLVYMDHCCCFGCASSSGIFGRCADAIKEIYLSRGVNLVLKWADDFTFWRRPCADSTSPPWSYPFDESLI